jgi:ribosomal protein S18 acetylase RimI-like enzyme
LANAGFVEARGKAFPEVGCEWTEAGGVLAMFDGAGSPCTQTFGLGLGEPVGEALLDELEGFFQSRGAEVFHEVSALAEGGLLGMLTGRGYAPVELSTVLFRAPGGGGTAAALAGAAGEIRVRPVEPGEEGVWSGVAARGWADVAPEIEEYLRGLEEVHRFRENTPCFLAELGGEPVAAAAMCLAEAEGVALLAGACTVPEARRRGAQLALLDHRLRHAAALGCEIAMVVAEPGSATQRNAERHGFRVAYNRIKWKHPAPR